MGSMEQGSTDSLGGMRKASADRLLNRLTLLAVTVLSAFLFSAPLRASGDLLRFAQDDFYYYLVVAQNLAHGLSSTFDGTTRTNGYHPLYLLVLWGASYFAHSLRAVFHFLALLDTLSAVTIFLAARSLFRRVSTDAWLTNGLALLLVFLCDYKLYHQMEVTLTLPLGMLFLAQLAHKPNQMSKMRWILLGGTAALTMLSRLDSLFLIALCLGACLLESSYRRSLTSGKLLSFAAGFAPLPAAYLLINEHIFHRATPISGVAKQLGPGNGWNWNTLVNSASPESAILFLAALLTLFATPYWWPRANSAVRVVGLGGLLFPFVHWGILLTVSDWKLWGWYGYSLRFAVLAMMLIAGELFSPVERDTRALTSYGVFGIGLLALVLAHYKVDAEMRDIAIGAEGIAAFTKTHPGRYAMGDRAGMVGYTDGVPTIQTEGLMMDATFLEHIRRQEPLKQVLREYDVDYYIAYQRGPATAGCYEAREPANAGPKSPVMKGQFCDPPLAILPVETGRTLVFAVR